MNRYIANSFLYCLVICVAMFTACGDDDNAPEALGQGQGEVIFSFERNQVYDISSLEEMVRLKVTLEKDGEAITLPAFDLKGDKNVMSSEPIRLDNGTYIVKKYVAFNNRGMMVQEAYLESGNLLTVEHGQVVNFYFPIDIRVMYSNNLLRSTLFGICTEVFGNDSTLWPKTWREENDDFLTWENLDFATDDYGNVMYLAEITFDGKFAPMKKLPSAVAEMATLESIVIRDIPGFEELPDNMYHSNIGSLTILNTGLKTFPDNFGKMAQLGSLTVINSALTEVPASLGGLKKLYAVDLSGNEVTSIPAELASGWNQMRSLRMMDTKLTAVPAEILKAEHIASLDLRGNTLLTSLPDVTPAISLTTLLLDGCGFSEIPALVKKSNLRLLSMTDNKVGTLNAGMLDTDMQMLLMDGNPLQGFNGIAHSKLSELSLNRCGLSVIPDLSGTPALTWLHMAGNELTSVPANVFNGCPRIAYLNLADNARLTSISDDAGFGKDAENKPRYLYSVNVDNCPALKWTVPATWNHIGQSDVIIANKEDSPLGERQVVVWHRGSNGVTRAACGKEGCHINHDNLPKDFEQWLESIKGNME